MIASEGFNPETKAKKHTDYHSFEHAVGYLLG